MDSSRRRAAHTTLAQLLRVPLERVGEETRLNWLGRYDPALALELLQRFGVQLPEDKLHKLERVRDLLDIVTATPAASPPQRPPAWQTAAQIAMEAARQARAATPAAEAPPPLPALGPAPERLVSPTPYDSARVPAAVLSCSDGRLGEPTDAFLHQSLGLERCDRLSCPGGPVALAGRLLALWECRGVEEQLRLLVRSHALRRVVLVSHHDCGYYRERLGIAPDRMEAEQRADLQRAAALVRRMEAALQVAAFYARPADGRVTFEPVALSEG